MSIDATIVDGQGGSRGVGVTQQGLAGALHTAECVPDVPPVGTPNRRRYITGLLGSTGLGSGTLNQGVDGSSTAQDFYVASHQDYDLHIMGVSILIADSAIVHSKFGNIIALGTGWDLFITDTAIDTFLIEKADTGGQVILQSGLAQPYGDSATSWELTNWSGTSDAQTIYLPLSTWLPGGHRIGRGTLDRLTSRVNDDLGGLDDFQVRIHGYRHYP